MPLISVIIPAYNAEKTIKQTIESVCAQTFADIEIIIINDGSTDRTLEIAQQIPDQRIKIFSYINGGLPVARNRGIIESQGEFISFIDADDLWTVDKLESQFIALETNPNAGVAYSWTQVMDADGISSYPSPPVYFQGDVYANLLVQNFIASGSNVLIRRQAVMETGHFDPQLRSAEDWDYWLRLAKNWQFVVIPRSQILYRKSEGAMSSKIDVMETYNLAVIEKAFATVPAQLQDLKPQSQANAYVYMAELAFRFTPLETKIQLTRKKLIQAIRLSPLVLKTRNCQVLIIKLIFMQLLTPKVGKLLLQKYSQIRARKHSHHFLSQLSA